MSWLKHECMSLKYQSACRLQQDDAPQYRKPGLGHGNFSGAGERDSLRIEKLFVLRMVPNPPPPHCCNYYFTTKSNYQIATINA